MVRSLRPACALLCLSLTLSSALGAERPAEIRPVFVRDLVRSTDPLSSQRLSFDATFARKALNYVASGNGDGITVMAESPAVAHILRHARNFDYDVPKDSPRSLVQALLKPEKHRATCEQSIAYFSGPMISDPHWIGDALAYLPSDFRFDGTLFLTYGYDIGVAFGSTASLNCTHPHFKDHPRELLYYAIHELHHTGFMSYQKPPRLAEIKTCADLLALVEYSTQLEGMAVLAAYPRRRADHALADASDYVALQDEKRMQADEADYFKYYDYLKGRGTQPADKEAWAVVDRMSSGERLWYRVGARMARRIEETRGRAFLVELVKQGPSRFVSTYVSLGRSRQ